MLSINAVCYYMQTIAVCISKELYAKQARREFQKVRKKMHNMNSMLSVEKIINRYQSSLYNKEYLVLSYKLLS